MTGSSVPGLDGVTVVCDTCGHRIEAGDIAAHVCPRRKDLRLGARRVATGVPRRDDLLISSVQIDPESVTIQFLDKADVRGSDGGLILSKQLSVDRSRYRDESADLAEVLATFVLDVLEDFVEATKWDPEEEDDDRGMGW